MAANHLHTISDYAQCGRIPVPPWQTRRRIDIESRDAGKIRVRDFHHRFARAGANPIFNPYEPIWNSIETEKLRKR